MKNLSSSQSQKSNGRNHLMVKRIGRFSIATLISRILGYARDALVAHIFGGEALTDAFYTAFRTSNLFRRLLGEGALSSSFVPVFSSSLKNESKEEAQNFLSAIFTTLLFVLLIVTCAGIAFAPQLIALIAPGFKSFPEKFGTTVLLTRWLFPFFLFISLAALITGVLNSLKHFFLPAVAPAMLSVAEISYLLLCVRHFSPEAQMIGLSIAVVLGGAAHFLIQLPALFKEKFSLQFRWHWNHPHSLQVAKLMLPAVIGLSVDQINAFVDTICATFLVKGSVTALYNSNRLMQLPLALFGISIASVSLPELADHQAEKNYGELRETLYSSLRMVIFTVLPASVGLIVLAHPIVALLFQHGEFSLSATFLTARALQGYSVGLLAYSSVKVLANAFYSLRIPQIPVRVAVVCMALNIVLNLLLMGPFGVGGLALATAIASWTNMVWLFILMRKKLKENMNETSSSDSEKILGTTLLKTLCSCFMMALFLVGLFLIFPALHTALQVLLGVSLGVIVFIFSSKLLKIEEQKLVFGLIGLGGDIED